MRSVLITGIRGFVGGHLCRHLLDCGFRVVGLARPEDIAVVGYLWEDVRIFPSNLSSVEQLLPLFKEEQFDSIVHLAGTAFVPEGWKDPARVLQANTLCTVNLLQAARDAGWEGRFLYVSSGEVYGTPSQDRMPLSEQGPVAPLGPYAVSKLAAEHFALCFQEDVREILIARPFNHIGPGQRRDFVVPSFLHRIRMAIRENKPGIRVGDLQAGRDFTDVRDVVRAYTLLLAEGVPGEIYNVCRGENTTIREILNLSLEVAEADLQYEVDVSLLRPDGSYSRYGSADKLRVLGWTPKFSLSGSIRDMWDAQEQEETRVLPSGEPDVAYRV